MPTPEITFDTLEGSELIDEIGAGRRRNRGGIIQGLDVSEDPDPLVLEKALAVTGMPSLGQTQPGNPNMVLSRIGLRAVANDAVRFRLEYEPKNYAGQATAFFITEDSSLMQTDTSLHPTGTPIRVGFKQSMAATTYLVKPQSIIQSVPKPLREIRISALLIGQPNAGTTPNRTGYVNSDTWPVGYDPLPAGYWLMNRWTMTEARYAGYFQLSASAITRNTHNWMMAGNLVDPSTGRHVYPYTAGGDPLPGGDTLIKSFANHDYTYEVLTNEIIGMVNVGHYPLTSFASAFGFGGS